MARETKVSKPPKRQRALSRGWKRYGWPVFRHMIVPLICLLVMFAGMAGGYVILGDQPLSDVWKLDTWKHMFDLIFAKS